MRIKGSRIAIAVGGLAAAGAIAASAASLGGLSSTGLGSNDTVVAACDTDGISSAYTSGYSATAGKYQVTAVVLSGIAASCANQTAAVTLRDSGNVSLGSGSVTVTGTSASITLSAPVAAESIVGASVIISG